MQQRPFVLTFYLVLLLGGCGGGGGGASNALAGAAPVVPTMVASNSPTSSTVQTSGEISAVATNEFALETSGSGSVNVYTNSSTVFSGAKPYVGETVAVAGSGSLNTSITATSVTQQTSASTPTPIATPSGLSEVAGAVVALRTNGFQIQSSSVGYLWIVTNSSTTFIGGAPAVGKYETVAGTGSVAATYTATLATQTSSAPGSTSASGKIVAATAYGFTLDVSSSYPSVPIVVMPNTTVTGGKLEAGATATVTGTGETSGSVFATQIAVVDPTPVPAAPTPSPVPTTPTPAPIATPDLSTEAGPVVALRTNGFQIDTAEDGYLWIVTNSSTTFIGGAPAVGKYETVGGTGSLSATYTATVATQTSSVPGSTSASGKVVAGTRYGFTLDVSSSYPAVPIVLTSNSVVAGGTLEAGAAATVTGTGETSGSILAVQVVVVDPTPDVPATPTPAPIAQTHVLTADYLGTPWGTTSVSAASAAPYLTWAQTGPGNASAIASAGIKTQLYLDPNRVVTTDPLYSIAPAAAFATTCSGVRVTDVWDNVTQYVMDPSSTALQSAYATVAKDSIGNAHYDAIYQDDSGPLSEFTSTFSPSLPCDYTDSAWISGSIALANAAPVPVIFNGLGIVDGHSPSLSLGLLPSTNTIGGNFEGCYTTNTITVTTGWLWTVEEDTELETNAQSKMFSCQERNTNAGSSSTAARIYAYASFLMTYNPSLDVLWEDFGTTSGLQVFPEEELVVLDPTVATPASVASLEQSGGAYGRQFKECFVDGKFVGACAVALNPTTGVVAPFPFPQFGHTLTLSGSGVLDGGTMSTQGAAPPEYLDAGQAVIAFP